MKRIAFAVAMAVLLFAGAVDAKKLKWDAARKIETGMTTAEVTKLMGKPNAVRSEAGVLRYVWVSVSYGNLASRTLVVEFDAAGKVVAPPPIPAEFTD